MGAIKCNGLCGRYNTTGGGLVKGKGPYERGYKYCPNCMLYIKWDGRYCPCCGVHLRYKNRHPNSKLLKLCRKCGGWTKRAEDKCRHCGR